MFDFLEELNIGLQFIVGGVIGLGSYILITLLTELNFSWFGILGNILW